LLHPAAPLCSPLDSAAHWNSPGLPSHHAALRVLLPQAWRAWLWRWPLVRQGCAVAMAAADGWRRVPRQ